MNDHPTPATDAETKQTDHAVSRRRLLLTAGGGLAVAAVGYPLVRWLRPRRHPVFLAAGQKYDGPLARTIADGLSAVGFDPPGIRGRKVLLKPNMVEPTRAAPHMTTHPAVVAAAAEVFLRWGAEVIVGEGPGHVRDTEMALAESGIADALRDQRLRFLDINYAEVREAPNRGRVSRLSSLVFPAELLSADLIVSMPKLKTHHWMGITAAMKNMYGALPGLIYGWPKNVLHYAGIPQTVIDINASLPPTIGIVDGIVCMEGDGPILGAPKPMGLLAVGLNLPALDATLARIAGFEPTRIPYLALAHGRLGPIDDASIIQRGERWQPLRSPFDSVDVPHLNEMRAG